MNKIIKQVSRIKLDEKKIRKGRPVGLPYVGSKKKVAKKIVQLIIQNFGYDKKVYDIFGGGGAITAECIINGLDVHYNDLDKTVVDMFATVLNSDREWLKELIVSREQFYHIKGKENKTTGDELKLLVNSFGSGRKGYLYGKNHSELKYQLALDIIANHDAFSGYRQTETYKKALADNGGKTKRVEQLERLEQLRQLQQLQGLKSLGDDSLSSKDYRVFSDVSGEVIYLDPPYENSKVVYQANDINGFNYKKFYDWAYDMAQQNIVIISSYEVSDDRFEEVFSFDKARSTIQGGMKGAGLKCEKLFMAKEGKR